VNAIRSGSSPGSSRSRCFLESARSAPRRCHRAWVCHLRPGQKERRGAARARAGRPGQAGRRPGHAGHRPGSRPIRPRQWQRPPQPPQPAGSSLLGRAGFDTLLLDLLTLEEEAADRASGRFRFDVELLAGRLLATTDWLATEQHTAGLPIGLFGASTGAGAALLATAERPERIAAVVSRGGRPDLAGPALGRVTAPTLLIVGALDPQVLELNRAALGRLQTEASLEVVPGASHLFEEPGTLERVAELAVGWFTRWLAT
jgi:putative phosphoribosyl transferase